MAGFQLLGPGDLHVYAFNFESHWINRMALLGKREDQRPTIPFWDPVVQRKRKNSSSRQGEWERWALGMCVEGGRWKKIFRGIERLVYWAPEGENLIREPDLDLPFRLTISLLAMKLCP